MNSSFAKGLSVLEFFKEGQISVHFDDIVEMLGASKATAYRYVGTLCDAGLLSPANGGVYVLGPKIIELDRLMRISDPLLTAGSKVMQEMSARTNLNMLLASYYRDSIMCVDIAWPDASVPRNFERGKPMSLFKGAMAKIILANLSSYQLRNMALHHIEEIREAGLGKNWHEFRNHMVQLSRDGYAITRGEMISGAGGISAPIFDPDGKILGSVTFALSDHQWAVTNISNYLQEWIFEAADKINALIANGSAGPNQCIDKALPSKSVASAKKQAVKKNSVTSKSKSVTKK